MRMKVLKWVIFSLILISALIFVLGYGYFLGSRAERRAHVMLNINVIATLWKNIEIENPDNTRALLSYSSRMWLNYLDSLGGVESLPLNKEQSEGFRRKTEFLKASASQEKTVEAPIENSWKGSEP